MKKRLLERLEKWWAVWSTLKWLLLSTALFWALSWSPTEAWAKTASSEGDGVKVTEVTQPWTEVMQSWAEVTQQWIGETKQKGTISLEDAIDMMKKDESWIEPDPGDESRLKVHGFVQVWTSVVPDFAGIFSDKVSGMVAIDAKDQKTWLWVSVIRLDDFHTDPEYPLSRASVVVPYWTISSKDGKRSGWTSVEFSFIDQMPGDIGVTPVVVWSYSDDGWTIEWKYFHDFREWEDMDAVRLWITKKIWKILSLTAQWWYKSDYAGKVYGRVIADVDLGGWFWAQLSCIARDWQLIPTGWVMYRF